MKKIIGIILFCALPLAGSAQLDLNALKRQSDSKAQQRKLESGEFQSDRNAQWGSFMDSRREEWNKVINSRDIEWTGLLSDSEWTLFDGFLTNRRPDEPKPVTMPKAGPDTQPAPAPIEVPRQNVPTVPSVHPSKEPQEEPLPCKPADPVPLTKKALFSFYGRPVSLGYDETMSNSGGARATRKDISYFWKTLSETNYTPVINSLLELKSDIGLNDWGYYMLVRQFSHNIFPDWNGTMLLSWFVLVRSGYDARVGISGTDVVLLLPSEVNIFDIRYLNIDGRKYYVICNGDCASLQTYRDRYVENGRQFDLFQNKPLSLQGKESVRRLDFVFQNMGYSFDFKYDSSIVEYYKDLPQAQFEVFFNASPSVLLSSSIKDNLKPVVQSMDRQTAMNFLLQFVQLSFDYKTDPQQFGYEKYFYADELFAYPYCDCEDRSVLFSYLVNTLIGYEVVGTEFPGHMATAVSLDYEVSGTQYKYSGSTYTIADPTYMNARVGQCMPKYDHTTPIIHKLDIKK